MKSEQTQLVAITGLSLVDDHESSTNPLTPVLNPKRGIWEGVYAAGTNQPIFTHTASRVRYHAEPHPVEVPESVEDFLPWLYVSLEESIDGLFVDINFEIHHWSEDAPTKNKLYRFPYVLNQTVIWYVVRITSDQQTSEGVTISKGETVIGRLARTKLRSNILKQYIPSVTPRVALQYMLEQFQSQHPWFVFAPIPLLEIVEGEGEPNAIQAISCVLDIENPKYLKDFLDEYFRAFAGKYFFRDDNGVFTVGTIESGIIALSDDDISTIEEAGANEKVNSVEVKSTAYSFEPDQIVSAEHQAIITTAEMYSANASPKDTDRNSLAQSMGISVAQTDAAPAFESGRIARLTESVFVLQFAEGVIVGNEILADLVLQRWSWEGGVVTAPLANLTALDRAIPGTGGEVLLATFSGAWDANLLDQYYPITLVSFEVFGEVVGGTSLRLKVRHQLTNKLRFNPAFAIPVTVNKLYGVILTVNLSGEVFQQSGITYTIRREEANDVLLDGVWLRTVEIPVLNISIEQAQKIGDEYIDLTPAIRRRITLAPPYILSPFDLGKAVQWSSSLHAAPSQGWIKSWSHQQDYRSDVPSSNTQVVIECEVEP